MKDFFNIKSMLLLVGALTFSLISCSEEEDREDSTAVGYLIVNGENYKQYYVGPYYLESYYNGTDKYYCTDGWLATSVEEGPLSMCGYFISIDTYIDTDCNGKPLIPNGSNVEVYRIHFNARGDITTDVEIESGSVSIFDIKGSSFKLKFKDLKVTNGREEWTVNGELLYEYALCIE